MKRKEFLKAMAIPVGAAAGLSSLRGLKDSLPATTKRLPRPKAVLVVSAHWETKGTFITAMDNPKTIRDFGGFPRELYEVQYPAPGNPELAAETAQMIQSVPVGLDHEWGLDHGAWTVAFFNDKPVGGSLTMTSVRIG